MDSKERKELGEDLEHGIAEIMRNWKKPIAINSTMAKRIATFAEALAELATEKPSTSMDRLVSSAVAGHCS